MAFNRKGFIQAAKSQGLDDDTINSYLESQGVNPLGKGEKLLYSKAVPWVGSAIGAAGGTVAVPGVGTAYGAAAGGGAASALQNSLKDVLGYQDKSSKEQVSDAASQAAQAALAVEIPKIINTALRPLETTKNVSANIRTKSIGDTQVKAQEAEAKALERLKTNKYYQMATPQIRGEAEGRLKSYFEQINPLENVNPGPGGTSVGRNAAIAQQENLGINKMYEYLSPFEKMGRAYNQSGDAGSTAISQGTNLASRAIRSYLNTEIPRTAQIANDVYGTVSKIQEPTQRLIKYSIPTAILYRLISKITGK